LLFLFYFWKQKGAMSFFHSTHDQPIVGAVGGSHTPTPVKKMDVVARFAPL
jgi:hypothetical protein